MGEYAQHHDGRRIKLGTCEDLMYVTRADLVALHGQGWKGDGGTTMLDYLTCKVSRAALPRRYDVPGDVRTIEKRSPEFDHRYGIALDHETAEMIRDVDHGDMCFHKNGVNFFVPCPMGKTPHGLRTSPFPPHRKIDLIAEGLGNPRAIYQCPFCAAKFNLIDHPAQFPVLRAFESYWCAGESRLRDEEATYLRELIVSGVPVAKK